MSKQDKPTLGQILASGLEDIVSKEDLPRISQSLDELFETVVDEALNQHKEMIFNDLLEAFDEQIGKEQQDRSIWLCRGDSMAIRHANGRVDGVDTGRALVENYFVSKEPENE
ncbi:hypothetical protein [Vibrio sp. McD22-P3]|uniref:hypothetical protein n=1 Tax=Vibrio sp. McD22-P3 TaxID=2724880 RepID=UPI001F2E0214|nr:hypothetical protein [Vibrio sp. McD22-P3]MCF4173555.1 hypothetical protein [Vibrio sp. McD22-P3]